VKPDAGKPGQRARRPPEAGYAAHVADRPFIEHDSPRSRKLLTGASLIGACHEALERMARKAGPEHDIFAETGEALYWLYSLGNVASKRSAMSPGLRWARNRYGHGQLVSWAVEYDHEAAALDRRFPRENGRLDPHHCWLPRTAIIWDDYRARKDVAGERAYDADVARRPVAVTLRAELNRLIVLIGQP
jgi:hypothetical protein